VDRGTILETAAGYVTKDRETQYGSPENNFQAIADLWNAYLDNCADNGNNDITAEDVGIMMCPFPSSLIGSSSDIATILFFLNDINISFRITIIAYEENAYPFSGLNVFAAFISPIHPI
jgi:hypothetical protein